GFSPCSPQTTCETTRGETRLPLDSFCGWPFSAPGHRRHQAGAPARVSPARCPRWRVGLVRNASWRMPTSCRVLSVLTAVLDQPRSAGTVRYQVLAWLCVATVIAYVHRGCLAVAQKDVSDELGLSPAAMGDIMAAFFLTYALFQLPAGLLGQHW